MAEAAITSVLTKFGELAMSEAKLLAHVGDDMMLMRDRLEWLQAFIRDADRKRRTGTDGLTRVWVRQTRDVAFEVEDALDEFLHQVDLESQGYEGWKKLLKYFTGCWFQIVVRHGLSGRLKKIKSRLQQISENQKEYKIEHTPLATLTTSTAALTAWRDSYEDAVGFDHDVNNLEEMLLHKDHPQQMFISIVGESGVGKSTLASVIIHKVKGRFDGSIFSSIVNDLSIESMLQIVYETAHAVRWKGQIISQMDEGTDITKKLQNLLANKRFLMVLKGISSKAKLNCLKACLPDDNNCSRVVLILDTENEEVAWHANSMNKERFNAIHLLSRLDIERSWQLFCLRVLRKDLSDEKENMRKYNKIVYDITGGYPLAIVVLAGLLRFKERPGQWKAVLQNLRAGTGGLEPAHGCEGNQILETVLLSKEKSIEWQTSPATQAGRSTIGTMERVFWACFEDLPNDLMSCFLYFATSSKNIRVSAEILVHMWIAEGFIKPQKGKTMEELGHDYIKELVLRCLVKVVSYDVCGAIEYVIVHQNLMGLLQSEAREAGFSEVHDIYNAFVPPSVRRLYFQIHGGRYTRFTNKFPKLRSFIYRCRVGEEAQVSDNTWYNLNFLRGSKFLRVIEVRGLRLKKLPKEIGDMIHLRYLSLNCPTLGHLPSSIKRLLNLQTLDIRMTQIDKIHPCFWKIKTLRHVSANGLMLPNVLVEELDELQTLIGVKPADQGEWDQSCPLLKMTKLRALLLTGIVHCRHGAALESALRKMSSLQKLGLLGDKIPSCVFTAPSLRCLEIINLNGNVQWPEAALNLRMVRPNLVKVILQNSGEVPQRIIDELERYI